MADPVPSADALPGRSLYFFVPGKPQPGGSKKWVGKRVIVDDNPKTGPWKQVVKGHAIRAVGKPLLDVPVHLELGFVVLRPLNHRVGRSVTGRVRGGAPAWPAKKPDVLKLARAVEDALTGVVYVDDALICVESLTKVYGEEQGVHVRVTPL